jgi:hypothetical protein
MAEQTHNTDMSDEPDRQDLEDRVEQLESTISKMLPSRRDALKLGGAALLGGAAMSGSASGGTSQAGTIGTAGSPVDVESEDINNADTVTTDALNSTSVDTTSVNTEQTEYQVPPEGSTALNELFLVANDDHVGTYTQRTEGVSTTSTRILDMTSSRLVLNAIVFVFGNRQGSANDSFNDVVSFFRGGTITAQLSDSKNVPETRSYSSDDSNLKLAMSSGTFVVHAHAIGSLAVIN